METALWCFCIEIQTNNYNNDNNNNLKKIPSILQSAILKAHCWDKNRKNVVPDIPLYIREENAMQTRCYFCCLNIGSSLV